MSSGCEERERDEKHVRRDEEERRDRHVAGSERGVTREESQDGGTTKEPRPGDAFE
jgi:hypothetical protein